MSKDKLAKARKVQDVEPLEKMERDIKKFPTTEKLADYYFKLGYNKAKQETIKEFAKRLKEQIKKNVGDSSAPMDIAIKEIFYKEIDKFVKDWEEFKK